MMARGECRVKEWPAGMCPTPQDTTRARVACGQGGGCPSTSRAGAPWEWPPGTSTSSCPPGGLDAPNGVGAQFGAHRECRVVPQTTVRPAPLPTGALRARHGAPGGGWDHGATGGEGAPRGATGAPTWARPRRRVAFPPPGRSRRLPASAGPRIGPAPGRRNHGDRPCRRPRHLAFCPIPPEYPSRWLKDSQTGSATSSRTRTRLSASRDTATSLGRWRTPVRRVAGLRSPRSRPRGCADGLRWTASHSPATSTAPVLTRA